MHRLPLAAVFLLSLLAISACGREAPPPAAGVDLNDILAPLREWPLREQTEFFGETAWTFDYPGRLFISKNSGYDWDRVSLPDDSRIIAMQVEGGGQLAFVVTETGIMMRTSDAGETWTRTDLVALVQDEVDLDFGGYFNQFEFDESLEHGVWVDYCQVFQTSDGGNSWTRIADGLQDSGNIERCVADVTHDAGTESWFAEVEIYGRMLTSGVYLFHSDDNGATWEELCSLDEVGLIVPSIQSCLTLKSDKSALNAAIFRFTEDLRDEETDAGYNFSDAIDRGIFVTKSLVIPDALNDQYDQVGLVRDRTSDRIWLDGYERLAYTDDGGERWHVVLSGMPENDDIDFSLGIDRGFAIYQYEYLAVTGDLGKTWQVVNDKPRSIYDLRVLPDPGRVILATEAGLSVIDTETLDWRDVPGVEVATELEVAGQVVWSLAEGGEVHRSTDAGSTWSALPLNTDQEDFYVEAASCVAERCLLEGYESVARLSAEPFSIEVTDLTAHLPNLEEDYIAETILDAELDRGWIVMEDGGLFVSDDGGRSWREEQSLGEETTEFTRAPDNAGFIAWGYTRDYLWSADGLTFERRALPADRDTSIAYLCWPGDSIALLTAYSEDGEDQFWASTDGGATWGPIAPTDYEDVCTVRGGLVVLNSMIAQPRQERPKQL